MQQKMADGRVSSDTDRLHKRVIETYVPVFEWKIIQLEVQTLSGRHVFEFDVFKCYSFDDFPKSLIWLQYRKVIIVNLSSLDFKYCTLLFTQQEEKPIK